MMRALFSGVAGLKAHQTKMDVIGNNIANVNTVGYKAQSVMFSDVLYQTTQSATGPNAETGKGGTNAKQIGLGSTVASMSTSIAESGGAQSTNNPFDLMINGDAMFVVSDGVQNFFTRAGNFTTDAFGNLVTGAGYSVMGWLADDEGTIQRTSVKPLSIYSAEHMTAAPKQTEATIFSGNINKEDESLTQADGFLATNVSFFDNLGYEYIATLKITRVNDYEYDLAVSQVTCNGEKVKLEATQLQNMLANAKIHFDPATGAVYDPNAPETDDDADDADGEEGEEEKEKRRTYLTLNTQAMGLAAFDSNIQMDITNVTCFGKETTITCEKGDKDNLYAGREAGEMSGVSIGTDGKITASYDNGDKRVIGQIVVAQFANLAGLEKAGQNLYTATMNSGEFDGIGVDITADGGSFSSGYVEMSNVDLAGQFTDMITTQRGFQANSRIVTVSDTLLEELINLKR